MSKDLKAGELADIISERILKNNSESYNNFKAKCLQSISKMTADLQTEVVVELNDNDIKSLSVVTEELRDMDYRFRFIEVVDTDGDIMGQKLAISIAHLI